MSPCGDHLAGRLKLGDLGLFVLLTIKDLQRLQVAVSVLSCMELVLLRFNWFGFGSHRDYQLLVQKFLESQDEGQHHVA